MEVRWGRQSMTVAGMRVNQMTAWITNRPEIAKELRGGKDDEGTTGWTHKVAKGFVRQVARDGR